MFVPYLLQIPYTSFVPSLAFCHHFKKDSFFLFHLGFFFLSFLQCSGSMTFWGGSGSADPCLWLMDPDPAIFVTDLQDASKKFIFNTIFSAYYFLKVHLHHFSKIKSKKGSQNCRNQCFSYYFCMMIEGSGSWSRAGTGSLPNRS